MNIAEHDKHQQKSKAFTCEYCPSTFGNYKAKYNHKAKEHKEEHDRKKALLAQALNRKKPVTRTASNVAPTTSKEDPIARVSKSTVQETSPSQNEAAINEVVKGSELNCVYCGKWCKDRRAKRGHSLRMHLTEYKRDKDRERERLKTIEKKYPCESCSRTFKSAKAKSRHKSNAHKDEYKKKIDMLIKARNENDHTGLQPPEQVTNLINPISEPDSVKGLVHRCDYCPETFKTSNHKFEHKRKFHKEEFKRDSNGNGLFQCRLCSNIYLKAGSRSIHEKYSHTDFVMPSKKKSEYKCEICSATFPNSLEKYKHKSKMHAVEWTRKKTDVHTCDYCPATFSKGQAKWIHKTKEHPEEYKRDKPVLRTFTDYKCDYCAAKFSNSQEKWRHKSAEHPDEYERDKTLSKKVTEYICDYCPAKFINSQEKWYHKVQAHKKEYLRDKGCSIEEKQGDSDVSSEFPNSDSEISERSCSKTIQLLADTPIVSTDIERSHLPLSIALFTKAKENPEAMMIVLWCRRLEFDLLLAASMNPVNTLLCVEDLQTYQQSEFAQTVLRRSEMINFNVLKSDDNVSQWTLISFSEQGPPSGLSNKLFQGYDEVEAILAEYATSEQMKLTNMMRYSKQGTFSYLQNQLSSVLACNCLE